MSYNLSVNITDLEPFKSYLVELTTLTDYIASKGNKTVLEQRILEAHTKFMKKLDRE